MSSTDNRCQGLDLGLSSLHHYETKMYILHKLPSLQGCAIAHGAKEHTLVVKQRTCRTRCSLDEEEQGKSSPHVNLQELSA